MLMMFNLIPIQPQSPAFALAFARSQGYNTSFGGFSPAPSYFSSDVRGVIINAGRERKMVELRYHGYDRLVEPYSMEYYVRKSDGVGQEYFWGYDTSGGESGQLSIKRFICDQIESVNSTEHNFFPRFAVEF